MFEIQEGQTQDSVCAKLRALNNFYENLMILVNNDHNIKEFVNVLRYSEKGEINV